MKRAQSIRFFKLKFYLFPKNREVIKEKEQKWLSAIQQSARHARERRDKNLANL